MLPNCQAPGTGDLSDAQKSALDAMASVVVGHLDDELHRRSNESSAPLLIQVDGQNSAQFVGTVSELLADPAQPWTIAHFDAWQYQRVKPPWWWLLNAVDQQLRLQYRAQGWRTSARKRARDYGWRASQFVKDLIPMLPLLVIAAALWYVTGGAPMDQFLSWLVGLLGAIATLAALAWTIINVVRRLFVASPLNAGTTTRAGDPMAAFQARYSFLIRSAATPVALFIHNLDRCTADYVVELLEGLQTLLKSPASILAPTPLVAVLIPAERSWLCESYVHVYDEFVQTAREPGRPFGLAFLDKVFDVQLRLPLVPAQASLGKPDAVSRATSQVISKAEKEIDIRRYVAEVEDTLNTHAGGFRPAYDVRVKAVERLGWLEVQNHLRLCTDTARDLKQLVDVVGASPAVTRQLQTAYCVQRTTQFLAGHEISYEDEPVLRLGVWTILGIRWPLLTQHLARCPDDLCALLRNEPPKDLDAALRPVFESSEAARTATASITLTADDVRRFSTPRAEVRGEPDRTARAATTQRLRGQSSRVRRML
jgi:hypothetical protein